MTGATTAACAAALAMRDEQRVTLVAHAQALTDQIRASRGNEQTCAVRAAIECQLFALADADLQAGRALPADLCGTSDSDAVAWLCAFAHAYDAVPPQWVDADGQPRPVWSLSFTEVVRAVETPFDVLVAWSDDPEPQEESPRPLYMHVGLVRNLPPLLAGRLLRAEHESRAHWASCDAAWADAEQEYAARYAPARLRRTAQLNADAYRLVVERAVREHQSVPPDVVTWLAAEQIRRPRCALCAQFLPPYHTHHCLVRLGATPGADAVQVDRGVRAACCSLAMAAAIRSELQSHDLATTSGVRAAQQTLKALADAHPLIPVPRVGGTNGRLVSMSVTVRWSPQPSAAPQSYIVTGQVCDGLAVVCIETSWRVVHVATGATVVTAGTAKEALVRMILALHRGMIDWTHPEIHLLIDAVTSTHLKHILTQDVRRMSPVFPVVYPQADVALLRPGQLLGVGDRFARPDGTQAVVLRLKRDWALAYDHTQMHYILVDQRTQHITSTDAAGRAVLSEHAALRQLQHVATHTRGNDA